MSVSQSIKNYYPPKLISFRPSINSKDAPVPPLQPQRHDLVNRSERVNVTPQKIMKKSSIITTNQIPTIASYTSNSQELTQPPESKSNLLQIIDGYEKRIKDLLREAAGLMEIVLQNKAKLSLDESRQERVRMIQDKDIEKEYKSLKEQLAAFRRQALLQQLLDRKNHCLQAPVNPEVAGQKHRKLHIQRVVASNYIPVVKKERSHSAKKVDNYGLPPRDKHHQESNTATLSHHLDHMTKRAQHYKQKFLKLEDSIEGILKAKEETDKINTDISEEMIKLRAEMLGYKYRFTTCA